ncbi:hypothetical protein [Geminicoccus roseus]|uniref:hypothetical protein n=1 Tax=Geminicoccus roseus TaxID=404900 RepID=UPI00048830F3|nr:hypothetical protein [Geminicoccus roseus]
MWTRRGLLMALGAATLAGCAGSGPGGGTYTQYVWDDPFYDDDWIYYYDEYDEDFLAGLDDAQKAALKERWDQLSPEEKQEIREQWDGLSDADRAQVRTAWDGLDADQRAQVISSMQNRIRTGTLRPVVPTPAQPSTPSRIAPSFARDRIGRSGRGGFGGRGGGRMGRR